MAWQKLAELAGKLLTKGRKVYLEGRLTYRSYTGKDGQPKQITEIVLDDFIVFGDGAKRMGEESTMSTAPAGHAPESEFTMPEEEDVPAAPKGSKPSKTEDVNPDDIPF